MKILPVFLPHLGCPFTCIFCNQKTITNSKLPSDDEIRNLTEKFCRKNADAQKEIAFFGGTFTNLPLDFQKKYFALIKPFLNDNTGIRLSTRPDAISAEILNFCRLNGVRTIELGVQSFSAHILSAVQRQYTPETASNACRLVKAHNFRLGIQLMPGLPGFNEQSLRETMKTTITLQPEFVRIYPAVVLQNTVLAEWFQKGKYKPLPLSEAVSIAAEMSQEFQHYGIKVIKVGLHSDIDPEQIVAGPYHPAFGELVRSEIYLKELLNHFSPATLCLSPSDVSLFKGFQKRMLNRLKAAAKIDLLPVSIDANLPKGKFLFTDIPPCDYW